MRVKELVVCAALTTVAVAVLAVADPGEARAQCPDSLIWQWPRAESLLPTDGHIVVKGFGALGRQVANLARRRPVLLGDNGDRVPVVVLSVMEVGQRDELGVPITEATLVPTRRLTPETRYRLWFEAPDPARGSAWDLLVWTTAPGPLAFLPEQVTKRPDLPPECGGVLGEVIGAADVEYLKLPVGGEALWSRSYRLLAVILFHCGAAVLAAAWMHARGRRAREAR
jgi:hypothetical protein